MNLFRKMIIENFEQLTDACGCGLMYNAANIIKVSIWTLLLLSSITIKPCAHKHTFKKFVWETATSTHHVDATQPTEIFTSEVILAQFP